VLTGDLVEKSTWKRIGSKYDFCFHLAAKVGVQNVVNNPYITLSENIRMTDLAINNFNSCKNLKKFIFMSTSEIYAETISKSMAIIPTPEETNIILPDTSLPRTSYMLSKIYGEALLQSSGLSYIIFRPHNIFGPRMGMSHVIPELLKKIFINGNTKSLDVYSPNHTRTFCYIVDAIEMIILSLENSGKKNHILNLGNSQPEIKILDLAKILLKISDRKEKIKKLDVIQGSPKRRCPNIDKILELTNFDKFTDLERALIETKNWYFRIFRDNK
jgi:nucleoside-diphosphate-sugar epimerase